MKPAMNELKRVKEWLLSDEMFPPPHERSDDWEIALLAGFHKASRVCLAIAQDFLDSDDPELALKMEQVALKCADEIEEVRAATRARFETP